MTSISRSRLRLVLIVLALCAVLSVVPLASAQSGRLPIPMPDFTGNYVFGEPTTGARAVPIGVTAAPINGTGNSITVTEFGEPGQFTLRLNEQPSAGVNLHYSEVPRAIIRPENLYFTPDNWDVPQVITVRAFMDYVSGDNTIQLNSNSAYHGISLINGFYQRTNLSFNDFTIHIIDTPAVAPSDPLVVTSLADSITEEIPGSLRQMIYAAKARTEAATITFAPGLTGTITLAEELATLSFDHDISIIGPGQGLITIDGNLYDGFINHILNTPSTMTIQGLTLVNFHQVIFSHAKLSLTDVTVRDNGAENSLYAPVLAVGDSIITRVTMEGNTGSDGGALLVSNQSTITDSTFINNVADGMINDYWGRGSGAIVINGIFSESADRVHITRSTFVGNRGSLTGAIFSHSNKVIISNSTFSENVATTPEGVAAVYTQADIGNLIIFSTFSGHKANKDSWDFPRYGGVIDGSWRIEASVIANKNGSDSIECGQQVSGFNNFSADPYCSALGGYRGIPTGVDPVLRDNGGLTMTHALLPGSNVIDSDVPVTYGNETYTVCEALLTTYIDLSDQRGIARPQFEYCDFGAFEDALIPLPPVNLLTNPSFEAAGANETEALGWTTRNLRPIDRRWCGTPEFPEIAPDGSCSFRFRGPNLTDAQRRLSQTVTASEAWGTVGDTLTLSADIRTREWGAASRLMLTVTYTDGTTETAIVRIPAGTNAYQTLTASLTLTKPAQSATVLVRVKTGGTKKIRLWVDNVILVSQ